MVYLCQDIPEPVFFCFIPNPGATFLSHFTIKPPFFISLFRRFLLANFPFKSFNPTFYVCLIY